MGCRRFFTRDSPRTNRIDGASHFKVFWRIMLLTKPDAMTLPVAIMAFRGAYSTEWGLIFASVTVSALPAVIAYLLLSRQFIAELTAGSVKG